MYTSSMAAIQAACSSMAALSWSWFIQALWYPSCNMSLLAWSLAARTGPEGPRQGTSFPCSGALLSLLLLLGGCAVGQVGFAHGWIKCVEG